MAKQRFHYDHGLPFTQKLGENLDDQTDRITLNKASMIVIDGQVGEGKTTLAIHCADYLEGAPIDLREQLAIGGGDFTKKMKLCFGKKHKVLIYDEAGDFNKRGSLSKFNAMLNRIFETYRTFNIVVILCLPSLKALDSSLLDKGILRLTLHCHDRNKKYGHYKGYSLYRSNYLLDYMARMVVKQMAYQRVRPNFHGHYLDLEPDRSKELDKITTKGKIDILEEGEILYHGFLTLRDICTQLDRSLSWTERRLKDLEAKPIKVFKKRRYYDSSIVDRLAALTLKETEKKEAEKDELKVLHE